MEIKNIKKSLINNKEFLNILKYSHYNPIPDKLKRLSLEYSTNMNIYPFASFDENIMIGFIVIKNIRTSIYEIMDIAVHEDYRKQGVASKLIDYIIKCFNVKILYAETDDEAVNFYRKYGFNVKLINMRGCLRRYKCTLKL